MAAELAGAAPAQIADQVSYFWSDQHGIKVQMVGWTVGADDVYRVSAGERRAAVLGRNGEVVAALAWNWPAFVAKQRRAIAPRSDWPGAVQAARLAIS